MQSHYYGQSGESDTRKKMWSQQETVWLHDIYELSFSKVSTPFPS